jgi:hypothetical protein
VFVLDESSRADKRKAISKNRSGECHAVSKEFIFNTILTQIAKPEDFLIN